MRQGLREERTALINRVRGLLGELGVWRGRSAELFTRALPLMVRRLLTDARPYLARLDEALAACDVEIKGHIKNNAAARRITAFCNVLQAAQ